MKKKLYGLVVLFIATSFLTLSAQNKNDNKAIIGEWKYEVEQAPYSYDKGSLIVEQLKDSLIGKVKFNSGNEVKLKKLAVRNDTIWADAYVDYEHIKIVAKIMDDKMKGTVNTSMGKIDLEANKVAEKQE